MKREFKNIEKVDSEKAATGITKLDDLLQGGLPRRKGYLIKGPPNSGKTTFAMHILYSALQRGEPCIFISYSATYREILDLFKSLSFDVTPFMEARKFVIIDHYSSGLNSHYQIEDELSDLESKSIYFFGRKIDDDTYISMHSKIRREIGYGGINVIDDLSDYMRYVEPKQVMSRQERLRLLFAQRKGIIGLHIFTPGKTQEDYAQILHRTEDGTFELMRNKKGWFMCLRFKSVNIDGKYYELVEKERRITDIRECTQAPDFAETYAYEIQLKDELLSQQKYIKIRELSEERTRVAKMQIDKAVRIRLIDEIEKTEQYIKQATRIVELEEIWDEYQKRVKEVEN